MFSIWQIIIFKKEGKEKMKKVSKNYRKWKESEKLLNEMIYYPISKKRFVQIAKEKARLDEKTTRKWKENNELLSPFFV